MKTMIINKIWCLCVCMSVFEWPIFSADVIPSSRYAKGLSKSSIENSLNYNHVEGNLSKTKGMNKIQSDALNDTEIERRQGSDLTIGDQDLVSNASRNVSRSSPRSINTEDVIKLQKIEDYYRRVLSGELEDKPDPKEIERHREILAKIFDQLMTNNPNSELNSGIRELLASISSHGNLNLTSTKMDAHESILREKSEDEAMILGNNTVGHSFQTMAKLDDKNFKILNGFPKKILSNNDKSSGNLSPSIFQSNESPLSTQSGNREQQHFSKFTSTSSNVAVNANLKNSSSINNAKSNSSILKRYGEFSDPSLYPRQSNLNFLSNGMSSSGATQPQGIIYQTSSIQYPQTQRGTVNPGTFHIIPISTGNLESITDSPLKITDTVPLQGDVTKALLDILLQSNQAGSLADYNNILESTLAALVKPSKPNDILFVDNVNQNGIPTNQIRPSFSTGTGSFDGIPPEVLANLLVRLQNPTNNELVKLTEQITKLGAVVQDTRQTGDVPATIASLLMTITTAISEIIAEITALCSNNPLACILAALALCALIVHIYKKHAKKKKYHHKDSGYGGGGGYGHDDGGYHRKVLQDYDEYRMLDTDTQLGVVSDILGKIDGFENWLQSIKTFDKENRTTIT